MIVWNTGLDWRQKTILSSIFLLVGFTIAVTVVRGTIFGGNFKSVTKVDREVMDFSWMLFWLYIEYIVCKFLFSLPRRLPKTWDLCADKEFQKPL